MRLPQPEVSAFPFEVTDDAILGGKLKLFQPKHGHRAGHDAILLAAAATVSKHAIDLGAGVGTAGLALLVRNIAEHVTLVEIDPELAELARANVDRNGFRGRAEVVTADIVMLARRGGPSIPKAFSADLIVMNPPFNDPARRKLSPQVSRSRAYTAKDSDLDYWITAADRLLSAEGKLVLIHRPETLDGILAALKKRFGAMELIPIYPRHDAPAIRVVVRAIKDRRTPTMIRRGIVLNDANGRPSASVNLILRDGAPLDPA
jgi:tRNA1(Val) A37 N6-methylase TrmN6